MTTVGRTLCAVSINVNLVSVMAVIVVKLKLSNECLQLTIVTTDKRKMQLVFKAHVIEMAENILVDFRLSRVSATFVLQQCLLVFTMCQLC